MGISESTAKRYYKKAPEFPKIHQGTIYRKVINPRLMLVKIGEDVVPAIVRPGQHKPGKKVEVEQIDKKRYRVL